MQTPSFSELQIAIAAHIAKHGQESAALAYFGAASRALKADDVAGHAVVNTPALYFREIGDGKLSVLIEAPRANRILTNGVVG